MSYQAINLVAKMALLIEPRGVPNTGDQGGDRTARNDSGSDG